MCMIASLAGFSAPEAALVIVLAAIVAFEIWMLVDVVQNQNVSSNAKMFWIVGMFLIHPIVAIVYFFTDHQKKF